MLGVELVTRRDTREPNPRMAVLVRRRLFDRGVVTELGGPGNNVVRMLPPLVIGWDVLKFGLDTVIDVIRAADANCSEA